MEITIIELILWNFSNLMIPKLYQEVIIFLNPLYGAHVLRIQRTHGQLVRILEKKNY